MLERVRTSAREVRKNTNTAEINRALADPLRIGIVEALGQAELSLSELTELFGIDERLMQYHLRLLVRAQALVEEHLGSEVKYRVAHPTLAQACHVLYEMWAEEARRPHSRPALAF